MVLPNLKTAWASTYIMTLNLICEKKLVWNSTTRGLGYRWAIFSCFWATGNPSPLVVEFQTKFFSQIWFNVMICVEAQAILRFESTIFRPKHFFHNWLLHTEVSKTSEGLSHPRGCSQKNFSFVLCLCPNNLKSPVQFDFLNFFYFWDTLYYPSTTQLSESRPIRPWAWMWIPRIGWGNFLFKKSFLQHPCEHL